MKEQIIYYLYENKIYEAIKGCMNAYYDNGKEFPKFKKVNELNDALSAKQIEGLIQKDDMLLVYDNTLNTFIPKLVIRKTSGYVFTINETLKIMELKNYRFYKKCDNDYKLIAEKNDKAWKIL